MSMKEEFLDEIHEGDVVMIYYGDKSTVMGTVIRLTTSLVQIKTANGSPRIALDSIVSYDTPETSDPISGDQKIGEDVEKAESARVLTGAEVLMELFQKTEPLDRESVADWSNIKNSFESREFSREFRNEWNNLTSNFINIRKQMPTSIDLLKDKMRKIAAKVYQLVPKYPDEEEDLYGLLASMYFQLQMYSKAEGLYFQAKDYLGAVYSAHYGNQTSNMDDYLDEYVRFPGMLDPFIYRLYAQSACRRKSVLALSKRIIVLQNEEKFDEKDYDEMEYLNACAFAIAQDGISWQWARQWAMMYSRSFALKYLERFVLELPEDWEHAKISEASAPSIQPVLDKSNEETKHISSIMYFNIEKLFGFISAPPNNYYFNIRQVNKKDELREVLSNEGMANNLEVQFKLGKSHKPGQPAAYDIFLTERGAIEAKHRLERAHTKAVSSDTLYGTLETYDNSRDYGKIYSDIDEKPYNVILDQIIDPYLKTYLENNFRDEYNVRVAFYAGEKKGKNIAIKVRLADDTVQIRDDDIQRMIRMRYLTPEEITDWPEKKLQLENREEVDRVGKDLYQYPYEELEPISEQIHAEDMRLGVTNVGTNAHTNVFGQQTAMDHPVQSVMPSHLPPLEPLPEQGENRFIRLTPLSGGMFYEKAHNQMLNGDLNEAERLYICAIRAGDRLESAVPDLVTVFLRKPDGVKDAIDLMDAYGHKLRKEKELNLLIQIYQKSPERAYRIKLCYLLDEAVNQPIELKTKFHYLGLQGSVLRAMKEYQSALNSCRRWYQLYDAEVQYRGQSAVMQFANSLNGIKRIEATCLYLTGETSSAEALARELLRVSTEDKIAQQILDGTLSQEAVMESGAFSEEEVKQYGVELSNFVKDRLDDLPLNKYLKAAPANGEYTDTKSAKQDIEFLRKAQGQTPSIRSERLLCEAKIVLSVQERFPKEASSKQDFRKGTEKKYIARSMAAYGDSVLLDEQEPDTARYAYLQAISILTERETDWHKSVNHYVDSYFHGKRDIATIVEADNRGQQKSVDFSIISYKQPQDVGEFITGMLKLRGALGYSRNFYSQLTDAIRQSAAVDSIVAWLEQNNISVSLQTPDQFDETLSSAYKMIQRKERDVKELMERVPEFLLSKIQSQELLNQLRDKQLQNLLCYTDKNYLNQICNIFEEFRSYFTIHDFQTRSASFDKAIRQSVDLIDAIKTNPTELSYDVFRPVLDKARFRLQEEREQHYRNLPPEIKIGFTESVEPYLNNAEVHVHLTIRNGSPQSNGDERQLADNIDLKVVSLSPGVEYIRNETDMSGCVYGGEEWEAILIFQILDAQIFALGTFDVTVECTYRYNVLPAKVEDGKVTFDEPIVFQREQRAMIPNPFHGHIGKEMEDEDMFKGREELINDLIATMKKGDNSFNYGHGILMYGQTRAGKSSIRIHFTKKVREMYPGVIQVDMKNLDGGHVSNDWAFYTDFLDLLDTELKNHHPDILKRMRSEEIETPKERMNVINLYPQNVRPLFARYLDRVQDEIVRPAGKMILLVADEFSAINTAIMNGKLSKDFMQSWKALLENSGLFAVCFGQDDTPQFAAMNANAFARMDLRKVTYLDKKPAQELMDAPIAVDGKSRYTPAALDELYELTSGSAYLIIKLCDLLVDYLNSKGAQNVTPGILQNFLNTRVFGGISGIDEGYFEPQLGDRAHNDWQEINRYILLDIARNSEVNGWADINSLSTNTPALQAEQDPRRRLNVLLKRLEERDVIEIQEQKRCRIKVTLLSRWLLTKYGRG